MIFQWHLICFDILYQYPGIYPQGYPLGAFRGSKTNYMAYVDNFWTKGSISDLNVSLDSAYQDMKLRLRG